MKNPWQEDAPASVAPRRRILAAFALVASCIAATVSVAAQRLALTVYGTGSPDPPRSPNAVWVHNLSSGRTEWKRNGTGGGFFTADGRYALLTRQPSSSSPIREIYDTATGVTLPMPPGLVDVMIAHPRELAVFGTTLAATQGTDVGRLDPGGLRVFPACSPGSVVQVDITIDGSQLVVRCGGFSPNRLIVLNAATGVLLREATMGPGLVSGSASNHDGSRVLLARATSANASAVELVDTVANQVTAVFVDSPFPTGLAVGGCSVVGVTAARDVAAVHCGWTDFSTRVARTELIRFETLQRRTLAAVPDTAAMHFSPEGDVAIVAGGPGLQLLDVGADAVIAQVSASVGGVGVAFPPMAPAALSAVTSCGGCVHLTWTLPVQSPAASGYVLEAGTGPGLSDIGTLRLGLTTRLDIPGVPPGRYYARVRATNYTGTGPASNELAITVP